MMMYTRIANQIEVQDDDDGDEEYEYIKIFEDMNNSLHENKEDEARDKIDCVNIDLIFTIF